MNLAKKNHVMILNRGSRVNCIPVLHERALNSKNIEYYKNVQISILKNDPDDGIFVDCKTSQGVLNLHINYLVFAIGREPNRDFISETVQKNEDTLQKKGLLYIIGDVKNNIYRQTAIAVGDGIMAAMKIYRKMREKK
ncbi:MAG: hypothetical protein A2161_20015 [Candidatus Schekmanbacteria bacterium RBG_13_48_7]|uniref:FAD/NAD(P)-binding domain-containing protein n=1 Tax=Candidatus Schekmanbacteria bacterium RBG_13_48_7 TaxID=1817878 RepID=A0A1F7RTN2_9BACT|nr:MAG: hypothetical protein A2161_20015 [Candidatus Schekmanbacteria bacterium RBG_13_48_7]